MRTLPRKLTHYLGYFRRCRWAGCPGYLVLLDEQFLENLKREQVVLSCTADPAHQRAFSARWFLSQYRVDNDVASIVQKQGGAVVRDGRCPYCGALQNPLSCLTSGQVLECGGSAGEPCGARFVILERGAIFCLGRPTEGGGD